MCEHKDGSEVRSSDIAGDDYDVTPAMVEAAREAFAVSDFLWSGLSKDWDSCAKAIFIAMSKAKNKKIAVTL